MMTASSDLAGGQVLTGLAQRRLTGVGSKAEMASVVLVPDDPLDGADADGVLLRRRDAKALDAEPELLAFVDRHVRVTGSRGWSVFLVDEIVALDDPNGG